MEEIKVILKAIPFWMYEKYKLKNHQGKSRPNHFSTQKRNTTFYRKLEKELLPILNKKNYIKKKNRVFIHEKNEKISYIHFALNHQRNGICVDIGEIDNQTNKNIIEAIINDTKFKRLKPDFWKFDYQYPVRKSNKYDENIINEIKSLLLKNL
ncbi:hypothetical protein SAMN04488034_11712 [Salinimicrobium catena]|uniref:Uncharacterized protein n=1 Tax=Salinimicrobium catena TaxID=390640 RepID=A0A1H5PIV6_9FLAO|nr:hypothetical protein [Salinimicrobium catena]SDL84469.1 hypothetical protein SAMN04488140_11712 [Salinimicrobium catena]SEF12987.1 hypothetical protein SAMN04488034_11712 [Salinimicrobium catena]